MHTIITTENLHLITYIDLREEAEEALADDETVEYYREKNPRNGTLVETVVFDRNSAGQSTGGNAVWGDWNEEAGTITTKEGIVIYLDGTQKMPVTVTAVRAFEPRPSERAPQAIDFDVEVVLSNEEVLTGEITLTTFAYDGSLVPVGGSPDCWVSGALLRKLRGNMAETSRKLLEAARKRLDTRYGIPASLLSAPMEMD